MSRPKGWKRQPVLAGPHEVRRKAPAYPWAEIKPGQSFFVEKPATAIAGCLKHGERLGRTFTYELRREVVDGLAFNGARVTRVS